MGMTIDKAISHLYTYSDTRGSGQTTLEQHEEAKRVAIDTMRKYQLMQADYENRLKADLVAMLEELQLEIEECVDGAEGSPQFEQGVTIAREQVVGMIQQKINSLKAESEDKE